MSDVIETTPPLSARAVEAAEDVIAEAIADGFPFGRRCGCEFCDRKARLWIQTLWLVMHDANREGEWTVPISGYLVEAERLGVPTHE